MIHVVSGYRRSGTSMMMKALYSGLTEGQILYQPGQEKKGNVELEGYHPNPSGLSEVGQGYYMDAVFLRKIPDNSLLKILFDGLPFLPKREYKIIWMDRDVDEILASCEKVDQHLRAVGVKNNPKKWYPFDSFRPYRQGNIDHVLGICEARNDIDLIRVNFRDVIENPLETFVNLKKQGIPIDPAKSAKVVNPKHYRYRKEEICQDQQEQA